MEDSLTPLGMTNHQIPDKDIIASSYISPYYPRLARFEADGWKASWLPNQFLQIDFGVSSAEIVAIETQANQYRVLEFFLWFSDEGLFWYPYMEYSIPKV
jgi:hypothetical protein